MEVTFTGEGSCTADKARKDARHQRSSGKCKSKRQASPARPTSDGHRETGNGQRWGGRGGTSPRTLLAGTELGGLPKG